MLKFCSMSHWDTLDRFIMAAYRRIMVDPDEIPKIVSQKERERLAKEARVAAKLRDNLRRRKSAAKKSKS